MWPLTLSAEAASFARSAAVRVGRAMKLGRFTRGPKTALRKAYVCNAFIIFNENLALCLFCFE